MSLASQASVWMDTNQALLHGSDTIKSLSSASGELDPATTVFILYIYIPYNHIMLTKIYSFRIVAVTESVY